MIAFILGAMFGCCAGLLVSGIMHSGSDPVDLGASSDAFAPRVDWRRRALDAEQRSRQWQQIAHERRVRLAQLGYSETRRAG